MASKNLVSGNTKKTLSQALGVLRGKLTVVHRLSITAADGILQGIRPDDTSLFSLHLVTSQNWEDAYTSLVGLFTDWVTITIIGKNGTCTVCKNTALPVVKVVTDESFAVALPKIKSKFGNARTVELTADDIQFMATFALTSWGLVSMRFTSSVLSLAAIGAVVTANINTGLASSVIGGAEDANIDWNHRSGTVHSSYQSASVILAAAMLFVAGPGRYFQAKGTDVVITGEPKPGRPGVRVITNKIPRI